MLSPRAARWFASAATAAAGWPSTPADHEARRRAIVGDHALEVEFEVAIAAVDRLDAWQHEVCRRQHGLDVAARPLQLGARGESGLETGDAGAARELALPYRALDRVRILPVHLRMRISDPRRIPRIQLAGFGMFGQRGDDGAATHRGRCAALGQHGLEQRAARRTAKAAAGVRHAHLVSRQCPNPRGCSAARVAVGPASCCRGNTRQPCFDRSNTASSYHSYI